MSNWKFHIDFNLKSIYQKGKKFSASYYQLTSPDETKTNEAYELVLFSRFVFRLEKNQFNPVDTFELQKDFQAQLEKHAKNVENYREKLAEAYGNIHDLKKAVDNGRALIKQITKKNT